MYFGSVFGLFAFPVQGPRGDTHVQEWNGTGTSQWIYLTQERVLAACKQIKAVRRLTLTRVPSVKLGQQSPRLEKRSLCFIWNLMLQVGASTEPRACIWESKRSHLFAVEGRRWLIFVAPVTCHCFRHKQSASADKKGEEEDALWQSLVFLSCPG